MLVSMKPDLYAAFWNFITEYLLDYYSHYVATFSFDFSTNTTSTKNPFKRPCRTHNCTSERSSNRHTIVEDKTLATRHLPSHIPDEQMF